MVVVKAIEVDDELYAAIQSLIPQLGPGKKVPARTEIEELIHSDSSTLLLARYPEANGPITGILTLAIYRVPTGIRSIVEDVIVDEKYRRQGIAEGLLNEAIKLARNAGAGNISLSSNPNRQAAISLYEKVGFKRRDTSSFIYLLR